MRNKHTSRNNTFIAVEKRSLSIFTIFKWLALVVLALVIALYTFG